VIVTDYQQIILVKCCKMYQVVINAVHRMSVWWLYMQSIKSGNVYLVGAIPMRGASI